MSLIYFKLELNVNFLQLLFNSVKISAHFYDSTTVDIFMYVFRRILLSTTKFGAIPKIEEKRNKMSIQFTILFPHVNMYSQMFVVVSEISNKLYIKIIFLTATRRDGFTFIL